MKLNNEQQQAVDSNAKRILCIASAGSGKALLNGTGVLTTSGYHPIESLSVGDLVFAQDGNPYPVIGVYPQGKKRVFEVQFNCGHSIKCNDEHLWFYQTEYNRGRNKGFKVAALKDIMKLPLKRKSGNTQKWFIYMPLNSPLNFGNVHELPLDPWLLGYLIANGCLSTDTPYISAPDEDIQGLLLCKLSKYNCTLKHYNGRPDYDFAIVGIAKFNNMLTSILRDLGLMRHNAYNKFVPKQYLNSATSDRFELLQGLFDGDGCNGCRSSEYSTSSKQLADDIEFLCECLGMTVYRSERYPVFTYEDEKKIGALNYRLSIKPPKNMQQMFKSKRHLDRDKPKQCHARRYVKSVNDLVYEDEMTCISVASPDGSFLTEHCIVTHNTKVLIERITRLVNDGVSPRGILALTFTNAAAFEMKERFKKANPDKQSPMFCTFHSFCYRLIAEDARVRAAIGYSTVPDIADDTAMKRLETEVKQQLGIKLSGATLSGKSPLTAKERFEYNVYWKNYRKKLRDQNLITFDTLISGVCDLFVKCHECTVSYAKQFIHIANDEFQDTDPRQWEFIQSFKKSCLYVCGDPSQAIYSFRDADSSIIKSLASNPEWEVIKLFRNYRSTKQICEYANSIYGDDSALVMKSERDGAEVNVVDADSHRLICNVKDELMSYPNSSIAILCRSNAEVDEIKQLLDTAGIKYSTNKTDSSAVDMLRSVDDLEYRLGWLSSKLDAAQYTQWIRLCAIDESFKTWDAFEYHYGGDWRIKDDIKKIMQLQRMMTDVSLPYERARGILSILGKEISGFGSLTAKDLSDDKFTLKFCMDYCERAVESSLYVGTIHSVKGLEYDIVHVVGVNGKSFRLKGEEMLNLFYVACTRARDELYVYMTER